MQDAVSDRINRSGCNASKQVARKRVVLVIYSYKMSHGMQRRKIVPLKSRKAERLLFL